MSFSILIKQAGHLRDSLLKAEWSDLSENRFLHQSPPAHQASVEDM
jgi:hypothetical protein